MRNKNWEQWSKQTDVFKSAARTPGINARSKRRIRQSKTRYLLLESALMDYIEDERDKRNSVTGKRIRRKALVLFTTIYPGNKDHNSDDDHENEGSVSDENEGSVSDDNNDEDIIIDFRSYKSQNSVLYAYSIESF